MNTIALYIGWVVIYIGVVIACASMLIYVPYLGLNALWHRLKTEKEFIDIVRRYYDEKHAKGRNAEISKAYFEDKGGHD